ncbi:GTP cyclohydrolase I [Polyangium sp. y55x31]|uniref:GTP cyclohydrolase I n=1 Tax=Polyangium sp. y55x31 TaxID=3042688 RepID=UPI002482D15F|nr:GTP cyclohydrolase I [Polyangium sp. y55x31]MDI1479967.1 GTP cyclohydrolase I [Polyangium sp. y55x31]
MIDRRAAARAVEDFLRALGHEPVGELEGTGERVADAWADDLLEGESIDAAAVLREGSLGVTDTGTGIVVVRDLAVTTICPHHLLPAFGSAIVAYQPGARVAGIGTLARVVDVVARRLTLQEQIGATVVDLIGRELEAKGALCKLSLTHTCLVSRGERKTGAIVETLSFGGSFATSDGRALALAALGR